MTSVRWIKVIMISVLMMMMIIVKVEADPSSPRYGHGAVLINKKYWFNYPTMDCLDYLGLTKRINLLQHETFNISSSLRNS
ncbi:hypothetical protein Glove_86g144 [Diversispora epigaea]|uniref:Uncharacterized protein n=1 Tax=Diversispora epigaea TaxID=1348612 RepID=A0A397JG26_9GLOM|nr:hypothetical protein Glove_86g144 [Diversispora epigaea]